MARPVLTGGGQTPTESTTADETTDDAATASDELYIKSGTQRTRPSKTSKTTTTPTDSTETTTSTSTTTPTSTTTLTPRGGGPVVTSGDQTTTATSGNPTSGSGSSSTTSTTSSKTGSQSTTTTVDVNQPTTTTDPGEQRDVVEGVENSTLPDSTASGGLENSSLPSGGSPGLEDNRSRLGRQARELEDDFLSDNPGLNEGDVRIVRDGDGLKTQLTERGRKKLERKTARELEQEFLSENPGLDADDVTIVREGDQFKTELTDRGQAKLERQTAREAEREFMEEFGLEDEGLVRVERQEDKLVASFTEQGLREYRQRQDQQVLEGAAAEYDKVIPAEITADDVEFDRVYTGAAEGGNIRLDKVREGARQFTQRQVVLSDRAQDRVQFTLGSVQARPVVAEGAPQSMSVPSGAPEQVGRIKQTRGDPLPTGPVGALAAPGRVRGRVMRGESIDDALGYTEVAGRVESQLEAEYDTDFQRGRDFILNYDTERAGVGASLVGPGRVLAGVESGRSLDVSLGRGSTENRIEARKKAREAIKEQFVEENSDVDESDVVVKNLRRTDEGYQGNLELTEEAKAELEEDKDGYWSQADIKITLYPDKLAGQDLPGGEVRLEDPLEAAADVVTSATDPIVGFAGGDTVLQGKTFGSDALSAVGLNKEARTLRQEGISRGYTPAERYAKTDPFGIREYAGLPTGEEAAQAAKESNDPLYRGAAQGGALIVNVPATALGLKNVSEGAVFGASETIKGRGGNIAPRVDVGDVRVNPFDDKAEVIDVNAELGRTGFVGEFTDAAQSAGVAAGTAFRERPLEVGGMLGASLLVSYAAIRGAARLGGSRAGRAAAYSIQPGEELVGTVGARATRAFSPGLAAKAFPQNEPLFMSEEAAIAGSKRVGRAVKSRVSGTARTTRRVLGDARESTAAEVSEFRARSPSVRLESDAEAGFLEIDPTVSRQARDYLSSGSGAVFGGVGASVRSSVRSTVEAPTRVRRGVAEGLETAGQYRTKLELQAQSKSFRATQGASDVVGDIREMPGRVASGAREAREAYADRFSEAVEAAGQRRTYYELRGGDLAYRARAGASGSLESARGLPGRASDTISGVPSRASGTYQDLRETFGQYRTKLELRAEDFAFRARESSRSQSFEGVAGLPGELQSRASDVVETAGQYRTKLELQAVDLGYRTRQRARMPTRGGLEGFRELPGRVRARASDALETGGQYRTLVELEAEEAGIQARGRAGDASSGLRGLPSRIRGRVSDLRDTTIRIEPGVPRRPTVPAGEIEFRGPDLSEFGIESDMETGLESESDTGESGDSESGDSDRSTGRLEAVGSGGGTDVVAGEMAVGGGQRQLVRQRVNDESAESMLDAGAESRRLDTDSRPGVRKVQPGLPYDDVTGPTVETVTREVQQPTSRPGVSDMEVGPTTEPVYRDLLETDQRPRLREQELELTRPRETETEVPAEFERELEMERESELELELELAYEQEMELETELELEAEREQELERFGRERKRQRGRSFGDGFDIDTDLYEAPIATAGEVSRGEIDEEAGIGDFDFDDEMR